MSIPYPVKILLGLLLLGLSVTTVTHTTPLGLILPFVMGLIGISFFACGSYETGKGTFLMQSEMFEGRFYRVLGRSIQNPRLTILVPEDQENCCAEKLWLLDEAIPPTVDRVKAIRRRNGSIEVVEAFVASENENIPSRIFSNN